MKRLNLVALLVLIAIILQPAIASASKKKAVSPYYETDKKAWQLPAAQAGTTQGIADYINANFSVDSDKTRAIFFWIAINFQYDVKNMFAINFYEKKEEKIAKVLSTKKGICENYAAVFTDVCQKCGLQSYVVVGYTKQNGFADYIPHAWCAARIDGNWFLFDPTWGSGFVRNGIFVRKINNDYYKVPPSQLIASHMPFDPMWEFLYYPVTNQEFYEGRIKENLSSSYFSYTDTIARYVKMPEIEQYEAASRRIEGNGVKNSLVYDQLVHLKREIEEYHNRKTVNDNNEKIDLFNSAVADLNEGVNKFNEFINYRNKQFKPMKPDDEIKAMFDASGNLITEATTKIGQIKKPDANIAKMIISTKKTIDDMSARIDEQREWLQKYFSKGKLGRATMFTKPTWMGIPLSK